MGILGWRRKALGLTVAMMALVVPGAPTVAATPRTDPAAGAPGFNWVLRSEEYGGVVCSYGPAGNLVKMRVRQPVVFARDLTGGTDTERVGWRFLVLPSSPIAGPPPEPLHVSTWKKLTATDKKPAHFLDRVVDEPASAWQQEDAWVVVVAFRWYGSGASVEASSSGAVDTYRLQHQGQSIVTSECPNNRVTTASSPAGLGGHSGDYGPHFLLESRAYGSITCVYDGSDDLVAIKARRPILFADDRGAGTQSQDVSWRIRILSTGLTLAGLRDVVASSTWRKAEASETRFADFFPITIAKPTSFWASDPAYRVEYQFRWHHPGATIDGRATHFAQLYDLPGGMGASACPREALVPCVVAKGSDGAVARDRRDARGGC